MNARNNADNTYAPVDPWKDILTVAATYLSLWAISFNWTFVKMHPGLILALIGTTGQVYWDWKNAEGKGVRWKKFFMAVLIIGLAYALKETAEIDRKAGEAIERAGRAEKEAQSLRVKADELEAELQPRRITTEKLTNFIFLAAIIEKIPIKICIADEGRDTESFAGDLRYMLSATGFGTNSGHWTRDDGITRIPGHFRMKFGITNEFPDVVFLSYGTNEIWRRKEFRFQGRSDGRQRPIIYNSDEETIYSGLEWCFQKIGITTMRATIGDRDVVTPGSCAIFIPVK